MIRFSGSFIALSIWAGVLVAVLCSPAYPEQSARRQLHVSIFDQAFGSSRQGAPDPMKSRQMQYFNLQHQVFETLVSIDYNTNTVLPLLAEKWERLDPLTIRFFLRSGVRFHNGERFNASSVVFTLDLMRNPRSRFPGRFLLDTIESVSVVDDYTVDIRTRSADGMLLRKLAVIGFMLPAGYHNRVGESYFARYPMGTGPFRFFYVDNENTEKMTIHFVKNEHYWRPLDFNFDELVYHCMEPDTQWEELRGGTLDMVVSLPSDRISRVKLPKKISFFSCLGLRSAAMLFNIDKGGPLARIEVRQALQYAVDRKEIISRALGGYGMPLYSVASRGALGHCPGPLRYREDIQRARKLLAQADYENGIVLKMLASAHEPSCSVAKTLQKQLARAGITLEVTFLTRDELIRQVIEPRLRGERSTHEYDLWLISGWPNLFASGTHFYFVFLHSGGIFNFGTYQQQASPIDALYEAAVAAADNQDLCVALKKLDTYLLEQSLVVPLYQMEMVYGIRKGIRFDPGMNDMPLRFDRCSFVE